MESLTVAPADAGALRLSVPGRICLFGEHSDWAGAYRRQNAAISPGMAIIAGTNQGLHATVRRHPARLIFRSTLEDGTRLPPFELPMSPEPLLAAARAGGFYSYAAGVAYCVLERHRVQGLEIDNDRTDLPVRKGLSSSAAVCVLVARAFNRVYDLKLTVREEMELAYLGEITTPSRCGRMDQGCAYGERPVLMRFDGDDIDVEELAVGADLFLAIVDLQAAKDTREILNCLNHCYPFADTDVARHVHRCLGPDNLATVTRAAELIRCGDAAGLGALMTEAQRAFDAHVRPACPSQLTAPALHRVLEAPALRPYVYGGKGVGSQGDGCAQFVARDRASLEALLTVLQRDFGLPALRLVLRAVPRVRKAVIPAGGSGTRHFPATRAVKKELFPVVGPDGRTRPAILAIVEEALAAGIGQVATVIHPRDRQAFAELFHVPPPPELVARLPPADRDCCRHLAEVGRHVSLIEQPSPEGLGHALHCAAAWVGEEPFLLLLGDHLFTSRTGLSCTRQVLDAFSRTGRSTVGLAVTPASQVCHFGCVGGSWRDAARSMLDIAAFVEKPTPAFARANLRVAGLPAGRFLSLFGIYVLTPRILALLAACIRGGAREGGEFQLTSCLDQLRQEDGFVGQVVDGNRHDIGNPAAYVKAICALARPPAGRGRA